MPKNRPAVLVSCLAALWLPGAIFGGTSKNTLVRIKIGVFFKNELIPGQIG